MIDCKQVCKSYGSILAVDEANLHVAKGERVALVGRSGNGKTTLLRVIAGLERVDAGTVSIDGQLASNHAVHVEPGKRGVGMMFQNLALWPHLNAEEQLRLVLHAWPKTDRWKRVDAMLVMVKLADKAKRFPHELSGGEQQRLALARALAPEPKVLLLDEPLSNLDPELRREVRMELLQVVRTTGMTTLMVTHMPEDADAIATRVVRMEKGRIV